MISPAFIFRSRLWRWVGLAVFTLVIGIGARSSQASFEVSTTSTSNFINTEFRSVWGYFRSSRSPLGSPTADNPTGDIVEHYDIWAVGKSVAPNAQNGYDGVIYYSNGQQWSSVSYANSPLQPQAFNTVAGQYNPGGGYAEIWFAGQRDKQADKYCSTNPSLLCSSNSDCGAGTCSLTVGGNSCSTIYYLNNNYATSAGPVTQVSLQKTMIIDNDLPASTCHVPGHEFLANEIYAMGADQHYLSGAYAGGQGGLLLINKPVFPQTTWQRVNISGGAGPIPDTKMYISGIAVAHNRATYLTATHINNQDPATLNRTCDTTNSTGRLYKVGTAAPLASLPGTCFFGLTVGSLDGYPADHSNTYNVIWIAANNGAYRFDESTGSLTGPLSGTSGKTFYSITNTEDRGGSGKNLLLNGDFESWEAADPANTNGGTRDISRINTTAWIPSGENHGTNNFYASSPASTDGGCTYTDANGLQTGYNYNDIMISTDRVQGAYSLKVEPSVYYNQLVDCKNRTNKQTNGTNVVFQDIPVTTQEGRTYRVTGRYKVEFPDESPNPTGPIAQGGVAIACPSGGFGDPQNEPDCSFENRTNIRTKNQGPTNGWVAFTTVVSTRNDQQFKGAILGSTSSPRQANQGMMMQIQCEANYGARVWCDDLNVEAIDDPALAAHDTFALVASGISGGNNLIMTSPDGTAASPTFVTEISQVSTTNPLYSVKAVDSQHIYAVGGNSLLLQHTTGNITGDIWVGTGSPVTPSASGTQATLGWIVANCANLRDASDISLCSRAQQSFGLNLENNILSGRAWFGKQYTASKSNDDAETLNLGRCNAPSPALLSSRSNAYSYTGACNRLTRTCAADANHACNRDFDCFGRCERDQGFVCTDDADCQVGGTDVPPVNTTSDFNAGHLTTRPVNRLTCGGDSFSSTACTALGWLSFNQNDTGSAFPSSTGCPAGVNACADVTTGIVNGWGRLLTLADAPGGGWVHLRGGSVSAVSPFIGCQKCAGGSPLNCSFCQDSQQHSCLTGTGCHYYCQGTTDTCASDQECETKGHPGVSCGPQGRCSLSPAMICSTDTECGSSGGKCVIGATCDAVSSCSQYGVNYDASRLQFSGYAWSADLGWLDFSSLRTGTSPFLQTRLGDIFAKGKIGSANTAQAPGGICNATYVILAGQSITNFCSARGAGALHTKTPNIPLIGPSNLYTNVLGRLDLTGLTRVVNNGTGLNKYGTEVVTVQPNQTTGDIIDGFADKSFDQASNRQQVFLLNRVFIVNRGAAPPLRIDQEVQWGYSAGLIVVNGDLLINRDSSYLGTTGSDLRSVESVVVVVNGDLTIDSAVTNLVGTYLVFGTIHTTTPSKLCVNGSNPGTACPLGGIECLGGGVCTTTPAVDNRFPLTIRGLLIAKNFDFARTFAGTTDNPAPAELVIFDGRFQSNPLPGMTDFASALPNTLGASP